MKDEVGQVSVKGVNTWGIPRRFRLKMGSSKVLDRAETHPKDMCPFVFSSKIVIDRIICSVEILGLNGLSGSLRPGSKSHSFDLTHCNT